jgi:cytohesin
MKSPAEQLFDAAWSGDLTAIRAILEEPDAIGQKALDRALEATAFNAKPEACRLLLESGADANTRDESNHESVLHQVLAKATELPERAAIVELLIRAGAEVNCRTIPGVVTFCFPRDIRTRGETPLHRAAAYGSVELIKLLLDAGADRSAKDAHGESPLTWASWHWRENDVLKLLLYGEFLGSLG